MKRMDRLLGYLVLLQSRGLVRAQDMAARFEISERTVYRDIQVLCDVGVPIVALPGEGYRLVEGYSLPPIVFSPEEARALFLAVSLLSGQAAAGETRRNAEAALEKVRAVLPRETLAQLEALAAVLSFFSVSHAPLDFDDRRLGQLQLAIQQRRVVHLRYHAPRENEQTERDVEPLQLAYVDGAWLLAGYCRLRCDLRNFRIDRIDRLVLRQERFAPREVRLAPPRRGERVVLRVASPQARWVRERQHYGFVEELEGEGGALLMVYRLETPDQMLGWLLSWGGQVEVLEPPELREAVRAAGARLAERHR
jgi:predicted DNA-binding transcriptional regulator YafY